MIYPGKLYRTIITWLCAVSLSLSFFCFSSADIWPNAPDTISEAIVLMDADTGQILYAKNPDEQLYPASITKVMTAMLALQNLDIDDTLTMTQEAFDAVPRSSSHIALQPGEQLSVKNALGALGVSSANDAANLLATGVSGNLSSFAELMTQTARELGAYNTHFTNANGLPDSEHYTTARDMAVITAAALKVEGLTDFFSARSWTIEPTNMNSDGHNLINKNRFVSGTYSMEGLVMTKTGWTSASLHTFITVARRNGTTLIVVALRSNLLEDKYQDTMKLMDYGFSQFSRVTLFSEDLNRLIDLAGYEVDPGQSMTVLLPVGTDMNLLSASPSEIGVEYEADGDAIAGVSLRLAGNTGPALPAAVITLSRLPEPTTLPTAESAVPDSVPEDDIPVSTKTTSDTPNPIMILCVFALSVWFGILVSRIFSRHKRRRITAKKIRRMKQRMGTDEQACSKRHL